MDYKNPYDYLSENGTENFQKDFYGVTEPQSPQEIEKENRQLAKEYLEILSSSCVRKKRDNTREQIKDLIRKWGLHFETNKPHYALSRDENTLFAWTFMVVLTKRIKLRHTPDTQFHT